MTTCQNCIKWKHSECVDRSSCDCCHCYQCLGDTKETGIPGLHDTRS